MDYASQDTLQNRKLKYVVGQASDIGLVRASNEDCLLSLNLDTIGSTDIRIKLFAIADGLGGHTGGEIASSLAITILAKNTIRFLLPTEELHDPPESIPQLLTHGVKEANRAVFSRGRDLANNMGTTLVTALIIENTAYIANVGDSRAYCFDDGQLRQITTDHSLVADLVSTGKVLPEDIYSHPQRNIITRSLGGEQDVETDLFAEVLGINKSLFLCSDGLWESIRDDEIANILLENNSPQDVCNQLILLARQKGGADNASVIVVKAIS